MLFEVVGSLPCDRQQAVEDFMDEDELAELGKSSLQTTAEYDTFGQGAAERARRIAATEQQQRPGLPSFVPDELITPVADSIGMSKSSDRHSL